MLFTREEQIHKVSQTQKAHNTHSSIIYVNREEHIKTHKQDQLTKHLQEAQILGCK